MITVDELKKELNERNYRMLTGGDDAVAERALIKAKAWIVARFKKCGREVDFEDELVREAVLKRALYELYSFSENEKIASDKKEDAEDLLEGLLGDCAKEFEGRYAYEKKYQPVAAKVSSSEPTPITKEYKEFLET